MVKKSNITYGCLVTCKRAEPAYYSNYGGNPECIFEPGMIGVVRSVDVPSIRRKGVSFCCVDFHNKGKFWRCGLLYNNIVLIAAATKQSVRFAKTINKE